MEKKKDITQTFQWKLEKQLLTSSGDVGSTAKGLFSSSGSVLLLGNDLKGVPGLLRIKNSSNRIRVDSSKIKQ